MSELIVLNRSGDIRLSWDKDKDEEVRAAEKMFDAKREEGWMAYKVVSKGLKKTKEVIYSFDKLAEQIVLTMPQVGG